MRLSAMVPARSSTDAIAPDRCAASAAGGRGRQAAQGRKAAGDAPSVVDSLIIGEAHVKCRNASLAVPRRGPL